MNYLFRHAFTSGRSRRKISKVSGVTRCLNTPDRFTQGKSMFKHLMVRSSLLLAAIPLCGLAQSVPVADSSKDPITAHDPAFMANYSTQYKLAWAGGEIPAKYKELTGVTVSVVIRCEPCLVHHINMAVRAKARRGEVVEAMRLGLIAGGSPGLTAMEAGYTALDAIMPSK